jgi:hypothetical protein
MALARYLYNEQDYQGSFGTRQRPGAGPSFGKQKFKGEILLKQGMREEALSAYQDLIPRLNVPYLKFQCSNCGFRPGDLQWQCPQCRKWDTIGLMDSTAVDAGVSSGSISSQSTPVEETNPEETPWANLTPMLKQYMGMKSEYPDAILFFHGRFLRDVF